MIIWRASSHISWVFVLFIVHHKLIEFLGKYSSINSNLRKRIPSPCALFSPVENMVWELPSPRAFNGSLANTYIEFSSQLQGYENVLCQCHNCVSLRFYSCRSFSNNSFIWLGKLFCESHKETSLVHILLHPSPPIELPCLRRCCLLYLQFRTTTAKPTGCSIPDKRRRTSAITESTSRWRRRWSCESWLGRRSAGWETATTHAVRVTYRLRESGEA